MTMDLNQAVAVVGVACRFPGGSDLDEFWETLEKGKCMMKEIPKDRWSLDAFYDSNKDAVGKTYAKHAGFIDRWDEWDNTFFGVGEAEAARMDPQHKIALECVYKATENAGISIDDLWGSNNTSVYMGQMNSDKSGLSERDLSGTSSYTSTGLARSMLSNRVSYTFNLQGPSMTLDTACSAGLVAVHQGIRSILSGESDASICGGVSLIHSPSPFIGLSKARMASETGKCHAFSEKADGYARGEGCGILVLKSISKAKEDGDFVWGYIASAINQDGHTVTPITAPSGIMQEKLLRELYSKINLDPKNIQYVEAHGTGTRAGDPIEIGSLGRVVGAAHDKEDPCWVGSVKTNIGHTESAAGIAGTIKVLLMMKHAKIAPSLHFDFPSPNIDLVSANLAVPTSLLAWQVNPKETRIACVNSFGFGGTNAHAVIMQDPPENVINTHDAAGYSKLHLQIVAISGKCQVALSESMADLLDAIKSGQFQDDIISLSFTSTARRSHFNCRKAFLVHDNVQLSEQLETHLKVPSPAYSSKEKSIVFVFGGMGTHWSGMGMQLMRCEKVFREKMEEIDFIIQQQEGWGVISLIQSGGDLSEPAVGQPAIFAIQVSLATLWSSWGVHPRVVIGLSVGEVAAAHISGKLTLSDAVKVICTRGKLLSQVTGGSMLVIGNMEVSAVKQYIRPFGGRVEIAAYHSPVTSTISGDEEHIDAIHAELIALKKGKQPSLFLKKLPVRVAFHSHHIDSIIQPLGEQLDQLSDANMAAFADIVSTVSAEYTRDGDFTTAHYWQRNARQGALFSQGIQTISSMVKNPIFIEISPQPALGRSITETLGAKPTLVVPSMRENEESDILMKSLAMIYSTGVNIDWKAFWGNMKTKLTTFPRYQYQRKKLYFEPETVTKWRLGQERPARNMISSMDAGFLKPQADDRVCLINKETTPLVYDHRRAGKPLVPAAMYAELGLSACVAESSNMAAIKSSITNVSFINAFHLHREDTETKIHVLVDHQPLMPNHYFRFFIKGGSMLLAEGNVEFLERQIACRLDIDAIQERCTEYFVADDLYSLLETHKYTYGKRMRAVSEGVKNKTECLTKIVLPSEVHDEEQCVIIHPAILDSCFQLVALLFPQDSRKSLAVPVAIDRLMVLGNPRNAKWIYMKATYHGISQSEFAAHILDCNGREVAKSSRIVIKCIDEVLLQTPTELGYNLVWTPTQIDTKRNKAGEFIQNSGQAGHLFHFYANDDLNHELAMLLRQSGSDVIPIPALDMPFDFDNILAQSPKCILFSIGVRPKYVSQFTEADLAVSEESCLSLLKILKYCLKSKDLIPVYVLTKHVHLHSEQAPWFQSVDLPPLNANSSLIGSALLGFARTAVREGLRVICIDLIHGNIEEISQVSSLVMSSTVSFPEWVLVDCKSYRNEFVPFMGQQAKVNRPLPMHEDDVLQIVTTTGHGSLKLQGIARELKQHDTQDEVKVKRVRVHPDSWLPAHWTDDSADAELLEDHVHPLAAIDFTAALLPLDGQGDFFGCQPIQLAEVVHVDRRTLVSVSLLPSGEPILSLWLVAWDSLRKHSAGFNTIRIHNLANWHMLEKCMRAVAYAMNLSLEDDKSTAVTNLTIVLASRNMTTPSSLTHILQTSQKAVVITSDSNWGVACGILLHEKHYNRVSFYNYVDLFVPHMLVKTIPKFRTWLTENQLPQIECQCTVIEPTLDELKNGVIINKMENKGKIIIFQMPIRKKQGSTLAASKLNCRSKNLFKTNGCYVSVGANKGMGLAFLRQMAEQGAGVLIALSRTPPTNDVYMEYELLKAKHNVEIHWVQTDATDKNSLIEAFKTIDKLRGKCRVRGIFQGAVVLADALIQNLTYEQFVYAYRVKVYGTFYLHCLTKEMELDYFVLHSSITAILGNAGQTAYGAANEFLNGFANYRRSLGLPGQSINWSTLRYGIIQWNVSAKRHLRSVGNVPLENEELWDCMEHALLGDRTYITYGKFDLEKMIARGLEEGFGVSSRLTFLASTAFLKSSDQRNLPVALLNISKTASEAKKSKQRAQRYLEDIVAEQLSISLEEIVGSHEIPLVDIGFNSMDAVYVASKVQEDFNIHVDIGGTSSIGSLTTDIWSKLEKVPNGSVAEPIGLFKERILQLVHNSVKFRRNMTSFLTVEISNCTLTLETLADIMKSIMHKLPHLRTSIQIHPEGGACFLLRTEDTIKVPAASVTSLTRRQIQDKLMFLAKDLNVSTQMPFKFQVHFIASNKKSAFVGMMFHSVVDDCYTMNQVISLLQNSVRRISQPLPLFLDADNAFQIQEIVKSRCSEDFWRDCLSGSYERVKLPLHFFQSTEKSEFFDGSMCKVLIDGLDYQTVLDASRTAETSLKHYLLSLFQLYIHLCSDAKKLIVKMTIDCREASPDILGTFSGNLDNELLIISRLDSMFGTRLETYVKQQCIQIEKCIQHGFVPTQSMLDMINFAGNESDENIEFAFEYRELLHSNMPSGPVDMTVTVSDSEPSPSSEQTLKLYVVDKSDRNLDLFILSGPRNYSEYGVKMFANGFKTFVQTCSRNILCTLIELRVAVERANGDP